MLENFTNRGNAGGFSASYEREFSGSDRLRFTIIHNAVRFLVPNELVQQQAGQRQDITNLETSGQVFYPAHHFAEFISQSFRQRPRCQRRSDFQSAGHSGNRFAIARLSRRLRAR